jgi:hypothetical protein
LNFPPIIVDFVSEGPAFIESPACGVSLRLRRIEAFGQTFSARGVIWRPLQLRSQRETTPLVARLACMLRLRYASEAFAGRGIGSVLVFCTNFREPRSPWGSRRRNFFEQPTCTDPADASKTTRVLTIMLAEEY